ncbi:MAG: hypothetical protein HOP27_10845 [Anaerolineales bacterium]|nr:hypothetical protein [Anaerolineales bacterium]
MPEFATLSCPSCGAKLQIGNDLEKFACSHCGNEHVVKRGGGVISISPIIEQLKSVRTGVDKTASELAIRRLHQEIENLENERAGLKGSAGYTDGNGLAMIGTGLLIIAFGIAYLVSNFKFSTVLWCTGGTFVIAFIVIKAVKDGIKSGNEASERRNMLDKIISEKYMELENHEKIVSGK